MAAPPIQYARTEDDVNIAYWTMGEGPPLLWLPLAPWPWTVMGSQPESQAWYERIAQRWQLVQYDQRAVGLSRAQDVDHALDACIKDIDAVLAASGLTQVSLCAGLYSSPLAIAYAVRNPDRVARLILWCAFAASDDFLAAPTALAPRAVAGGSDWTSLVRTLMAHGTGWDHPDYARNVADAALAHTTQAEFEGAHRRNYHDDVTELLPSVVCPTLVMYPEDSAAPLELGQRLAAGIPGAQLRVFPGDSLIPELCAPDEIFDAIVEFLPAGSGSAQPDAASRPDGFRAILFTDVVASTPLLAQLKDAKMRDVMRDHDAVLDAAVAEHGGRVVKEIGDAFMVEFAIPSAAVECAIAIQRGIRDQFADSDVPIRLRIGINAGEPVVEDDDLHGASVNIAKRLESAADTDGILVSDVVKQAVVGKDFAFEDQGDIELKGFDDPVHAWSVEWA